jgi:hypothetical protein
MDSMHAQRCEPNEAWQALHANPEPAVACTVFSKFSEIDIADMLFSKEYTGPIMIKPLAQKVVQHCCAWNMIQATSARSFLNNWFVKREEDQRLKT